MGFGDLWNRTLVYFGIAEEDEEWDEDGYLTDEELQRTYAERPNVRRLTPRRSGRSRDYDDWTDPEPASAPTVSIRPDPPRSSRQSRQPVPSIAPVAAVPSVRVHLVLP